MGSGLGARISLPEGRKDGVLFTEAVGAMLLEVDKSADAAKLFDGLPWFPIGEVIELPDLDITGILKVPIDDLVKVWEKPFAEVVR